ncbi:glycoside hydrolase family 13 protein [Sistotremastrum suecicum HHB10207 ss-3]|uniref:Glycogen debranching enzyme n=1 Tax=Sistotremastrum suecicum HHB10207 ss-3 TaxID=1314776 RepID=A0A166HVI1_9AGAM|nr:glycoside hydrolase family 13 protein [Sistotremastrum suecicum HHB10207 ss-3]
MKQTVKAAAAVLHGRDPKEAVESAKLRTKPPTVEIPKSTGENEPLKTPKTPADEGIEFFESSVGQEAPILVHELKLDDDGGPSKELSYIRLPPPLVPYILRVVLDAGTPASRKAIFKTNFPLDGGKFSRAHFVERTLPTNLSKPIKIDLPISHAGAFLYWLEYDGPSGRVKGREGYFNIDPILRVKKRSPILSPDHRPLPITEGGQVTSDVVPVPLDGLVILTVVSKWMGTVDEWRPHLQEARERGYNMLHYTPLQQRGESHSPYSIADQLSYDEALFPGDKKPSSKAGTEQVKDILKVARDDYGLLSLTDVVLNHTANNSPWLLDHPEAGFSPHNTPHLAPALEIDTAMIEFSASLESRGLPTKIQSASDVDRLMESFERDFKDLRLWQYYVLNTDNERTAVKKALDSGDVQPWRGDDVAGKDVVALARIVITSGHVRGLAAFSGRFAVSVDSKAAAGLVKAAFIHLDNSDAQADAWVRVVDVLNVDLYEEANRDAQVALDNIKNRLKYTRLDANGPRLGEITRQLPLVETYFTRLPANERTSKHPPASLSVANNGWIWDADPLVNFAMPPSKAYLRREVIVWGDCVKLRYGDGPESNPWLWEYMTSYVTSLATQFDGFRIDNCHSTPLHVGIALLDAARVVNPDLYVCAELFTGNEDMDTHFVSRLGINSLIRESYNGWDPKELSRLLYRHGLNKPIGSMGDACLTSPEELAPPTGKGPVRQCLVSPLHGSLPHALLYDLTHDNESPLHKRSAEDALSTGALVAFSYCATGSVKGFDDLYPKLLDLVGDNRRYEIGNLNSGRESGISHAKRILNHLHVEMVLDKYTEGHVHQENDYIVLHRVQPETQQGYLLVAHTAFSKGSKDRGWVNPIKLARTKATLIFGASINIPSYDLPWDPKVISGLPSELVEITNVQVNEGTDANGTFSEIIVPDFFPPGSIAIFATQMQDFDASLDKRCTEGADEAFAELDLLDLNVLLYRADGEERDATDGAIGAYDVPGLGKLVYCGLEGWMHPLRHVIRHNDLGHPLAGHLRDGVWALDYIHSRLSQQTNTFPRLAKPAAWFQDRAQAIETSVPAFLRPKYFAITISEAYKAARRAAIEQFSDFVTSGHDFTQDLALCAIQMHGLVKSASLDPSKPVPCLAAGLPHFSAGWARTWGRDVFISLRGLFLTTGNFEAAKRHILAFSSTVKHGLIPNLLDSIRNPRYNSRDSPWWMLQNIQDYVNSAPDGLSLLQEPVKRRFPKDDTFVPWDDPRAYAESNTVIEIIQEILQRHAEGISFREYNAGPNLDQQMSDPGFNIDIYVDWKTGIIHGGNESNCGTWMDKMGESTKAGTKGLPGTPRDGAPVEITGLLKSTLRWLDSLSSKGHVKFRGVNAKVDGQDCFVTYKEWSDLLQSSFEHQYYVPEDPKDDAAYNVDPNIVNRRGIYKDVLGSGRGREWSDYQFRCNFPIAMTVAPELFDPKHALAALKLADKVLKSPLGMKTLDPSDSQYRGDYDNSNDSTDPSVAKGRNYHQGPEWGWPLGYFLRAYLHFSRTANETQDDAELGRTTHYLISSLLPARRHLKRDAWAGLPELTNREGAFCYDSCPTQAWSASTLLDFLEEVHKFVNA